MDQPHAQRPDTLADPAPESASNGGAPTFLVPPVKQPPLDPAFAEVAKMVRDALYRAMQRLRLLPTQSTEQAKCVWMWHTALTTLTWDVSELALYAAIESSSLRGARSLNRQLLEYAARVHLYITQPALAEVHVGEATNMLRRVMKPAAASGAADPGLQDVRALMQSGTTKASQPKVREMIEAMVATFVTDPAKRGPFVEFLDAEYALGNGYVHGSQTSFFDLFDGNTGQLHPRTRVLYRRAEVVRGINCMIVLLAGLEKQYGWNLASREFIGALRVLGPYDEVTSIGVHDALIALLGIR